MGHRPATSLVELLERRAREQGRDLAYVFLPDGEAEGERLTFAELAARARALAVRLAAAAAPGERVILLYPSGLDFVVAFFGCLYARLVAVPAAPPHPARPGRSAPRLRAIARDAGARLVLAPPALAALGPLLAGQTPELVAAEWLAVDLAAAAEAPAGPAPPVPDVAGTALALLQYTSGSTAAPRGVMVSHANLLHNLSFAAEAAEDGAGTVSVSWLPTHHDMGLIEGLLGPVYGGYPAHLMPPVAFLARPLRWLETIARVRATKSGGPNFAYDLCVRRSTPEQRRALDLGSWRVAYNGAEPVRADTLRAFHAAFAPAGFRWQSFYPVYGLAEATLAVSSDRQADAPTICRVRADALAVDRIVETADAGVEVVACGRPAAGARVTIVDPATGTPCAPDRIGEIWLASPSVARGYWGQPELTAATFGARLAGTGEGPFLRTGDLGVLRDGRLVVTGRLKDVVIVRGKKHYPQDLERSAEASHPALGACAAFAVDGPEGERVVVAAELARRAPSRAGAPSDPDGPGHRNAAIAAVRQALSEHHELQVHEVVLVPPGGLPRTTSGKLQRHACRAAWLAGALPRATEAGPEDRVTADAATPAGSR